MFLVAAIVVSIYCAKCSETRTYNFPSFNNSSKNTKLSLKDNGREIIKRFQIFLLSNCFAESEKDINIETTSTPTLSDLYISIQNISSKQPEFGSSTLDGLRYRHLSLKAFERQ